MKQEKYRSWQVILAQGSAGTGTITRTFRVEAVERPASSETRREEFCLVFPPKSDTFRFDGSKRIRCVLADDHTLLRDGVRRVLEEASDFAVVGEAADASEALKMVIEHR